MPSDFNQESHLIVITDFMLRLANFSGRIPCIEGESVVAREREALETAIRFSEGEKRWGAKVVYGDTGSVFVVLRGKTKDEAFDIGEESHH